MVLQRISPYLKYDGDYGIKIFANVDGSEEKPWSIMDGNNSTRWQPGKAASISVVFPSPVVISRVRLRTQPSTTPFALHVVNMDDDTDRPKIATIDHSNAIDYWSDTDFPPVKGKQFIFVTTKSVYLYELEFWGESEKFILELQNKLYTISTKGLELVSQNTEGSLNLYETKGFEMKALNSTIMLDGKDVPIMDVIKTYSQDFKIHVLKK